MGSKPKYHYFSKYGFSKPEKEIFDLACNQFCMEPEHTLYVGDSYDNDIVGARNGGWHSLWFNHRSRELPSCQPASHLAEVTCFTELCPTVEKLFNL